MSTLIAAAIPLPDASAAEPARATTRKTYDIPAGPLESALNRFGRESGILLSFPSALAAHRTSAGLRGEYGVEDALVHLLAGTGLEAQAQDDGSFTLNEAVAPAASGASSASDTTLPAVTVTRSALKGDIRTARRRKRTGHAPTRPSSISRKR